MAATAMMGAFGLCVSAQAFVVAPSTASASRPIGSFSPVLTASQADAAAAGTPDVGLWCIGGVAALVSASAAGRRSSARFRGSVAVKVGKAANLIAQRLEEACKVSANFEKCMGDLQTQNDSMMKELEMSKSQALALAEERKALTSQLQGLVGKIDSALADPSKLSSATVAKLTSLKQAAAASASASLPTPAAAPAPAAARVAAPASSPAVARVATSYPPPKAKKGMKKGKTFFPLPYPDFSIGQCYAY